VNPVQPNPRSAVQRLIDGLRPAREFVDLIRALKLGYAPPAEQWVSYVAGVAAIAGSGLEWMSRKDRGWLTGCLNDFMITALTESRTEEHPSAAELEQVLLPFLRWLEGQAENHVLRFCWEVLSFRPRPHGSNWTYPVHWLRRADRLNGAVSYSNIECAIVLADEAEAMFWWPDERWAAVQWERDSQVYADFISHGSYVVRGAAAKALGELFWGCGGSSAKGSPDIAKILQWLQSQEQEHPGVAGPFLHGSHWSCGELVERFPGFDFRAWILQTLRSSGAEPELPKMQSLEFYAHEYFCSDAEAIEEMLEMGRHGLAVLTVTEEPNNIELLQPVLDRMTRHDHPGVARAIRHYLVEREHHSGWQFMEEN
jgi:hypothetical protein